MTGEEAKKALLNECPVIWDGKEYKCVSAIVYKKSKFTGNIVVLLQLLDKNQNSLVETSLKDVELKRE